MASTPPPLPPPPPPSPQENLTQPPPSFLKNFIEKNSHLDPIQSKQQKYTSQYLAKQCLIPTTTPENALPDIESLLSLNKHVELPEEESPREECEYRSALQDYHDKLTHCSQYKQISEVNQNIYKFKIKRWKLNKLKNESPQSKHQEIEEKIAQLESPPYNEEYSDLKVMQNYSLAKIFAVNYKVCLASAACPRQTRSLVNCYKALDPRVAKMLEEQGLGKVLCMEEREALERCVGNSVQRIVKEVIG